MFSVLEPSAWSSSRRCLSSSCFLRRKNPNWIRKQREKGGKGEGGRGREGGREGEGGGSHTHHTAGHTKRKWTTHLTERTKSPGHVLLSRRRNSPGLLPARIVSVVARSMRPWYHLHQWGCVREECVQWVICVGMGGVCGWCVWGWVVRACIGSARVWRGWGQEMALPCWLSESISQNFSIHVFSPRSPVESQHTAWNKEALWPCLTDTAAMLGRPGTACHRHSTPPGHFIQGKGEVRSLGS